jgi:hypothetical protein
MIKGIKNENGGFITACSNGQISSSLSYLREGDTAKAV